MSELKPVAWASVPDKINGHSYIKLGEDNPNEKIYTIPLYTKGQLQPRVQLPVEEE